MCFRADGKIIARQPRQISSILLETPNHQSTKTGHASIATKTNTASTKTRNLRRLAPEIMVMTIIQEIKMGA